MYPNNNGHLYREQGKPQRLRNNNLKILSLATGHKYSEQDILKKISFVITDSMSHYLEVIGLLGDELEVEHIPKILLCNIHLLMMFQGKMNKLYQDIHNSLGIKKIADFSCQCGIQKRIIFINQGYSSKPWNRPGQFAFLEGSQV